MQDKEPEVIKSDKSNFGMVSGNISVSKFRFWEPWSTIKRLIFLVIALLLIIIISTVLIIINDDKDQKISNPPDANLNVKPTIYDKISTKVNNGDFTGAQKILDDNPTIKNSIQGVSIQASILSNQGDRQGATNILAEGEKTYGINSALAGQLGDAYVDLGQKELAIKYYNIKIQLIKDAPKYPLKNADINYYEQLVGDLSKW